MKEYKLIDPRTAAKTRMTPDEAQAVIEMWSLQHRLQETPDGPSLADLAEGLTIPPSEVHRYLRQIRSSRPPSVRPARSVGADVRLAIAAMATLVLIAASISSAIRRPYLPDRFMAPSPSRIASNGMRVTEFRNYLQGDWYLDDTIVNASRYAFSVGTRVYQPLKPVKPELDELKAAIRSCVGGTLASSSTVRTRSVDKESIEDALAQAPNERRASRRYSYDGYSGGPDDLVQWDQVQVVLDHKVTQTNLPYARIADPELQKAVQVVQDRLIASLAKAAIDLKGGAGQATGSF